MQVTIKNIKKEDRLCMKPPTPKALFAKGVFQINPLFLVLTFQIIHQYPIKLLSINLKDESFCNSTE